MRTTEDCESISTAFFARYVHHELRFPGKSATLSNTHERPIRPTCRGIETHRLCVCNSVVRVSINKQFLEAGVHHVGNQRAVVSTNSLQSLAIHLVVLIRTREVQSSVP